MKISLLDLFFMANSLLVPVVILTLIEDQDSGSPIVVLHDAESNRVLPMWIGDAEARALALALNRVQSARPLTHTLLLKTAATLGARLSRVVVDRLRNNTYFASLYLKGLTQEFQVDARPSDALALALEAQVPIFVEQKIFSEASHKNPFPASPIVRTTLKKARQKPSHNPLENMTPQQRAELAKLLQKARDREAHSQT